MQLRVTVQGLTKSSAQLGGQSPVQTMLQQVTGPVLCNIPCATGSFPSGARSVPREMIPRGAFMGTAYAR